MGVGGWVGVNIRGEGAVKVVGPTYLHVLLSTYKFRFIDYLYKF